MILAKYISEKYLNNIEDCESSFCYCALPKSGSNRRFTHPLPSLLITSRITKKRISKSFKIFKVIKTKALLPHNLVGDAGKSSGRTTH